MLVVASMLALGPRSLVVVVVVVVSFVVSQPTNAIAHTPRTTGINFFMTPFYQTASCLSRRSSAKAACHAVAWAKAACHAVAWAKAACHAVAWAKAESAI